MSTVIFKCNDCGTIMVVNTKDVWCLSSCTKCESTNITNLDESFDESEILEDKNVKQDK